MKNNIDISVIGGDSRQLFAAEYLANIGYTVGIYGCEHADLPQNTEKFTQLKRAMDSDIILLPLPTSKNGKSINTPLSSREIPIKTILDYLSSRHTVFIGMGQAQTVKQIHAKTGKVFDYFTVEDFTYKNALLTAEGILEIILDRLPITVFGLKTAVFGYGRIGYFIGDMLKKLGADVTVFARNGFQLTKAEVEGLHTQNLSETFELNDYDCIINTVPSRIIDTDALKTVKKDCLLIEAASVPYGINTEFCEKNGYNLIKASSLPGKTAPKTAGIIIGETVEKQLSEVKYFEET